MKGTPTPGMRCILNGHGDLAFYGESRKFMDEPCRVVKVCESGYIQVALESDPKATYSAPKRNVSRMSDDGVIGEPAAQEGKAS